MAGRSLRAARHYLISLLSLGARRPSRDCLCVFSTAAQQRSTGDECGPEDPRDEPRHPLSERTLELKASKLEEQVRDLTVSLPLAASLQRSDTGKPWRILKTSGGEHRSLWKMPSCSIPFCYVTKAMSIVPGRQRSIRGGQFITSSLDKINRPPSALLLTSVLQRRERRRRSRRGSSSSRLTTVKTPRDPEFLQGPGGGS
ncbi:grpE protein homolog 2, mitochondrial isoform X2 [Chelonia mydas]|uniref:grpE protein homolog 2, mitochondrial isoform X2 n=1 Tax=Chelonia mydas TaxID=8469 RepID=UPI001CA9131C|nr:grpE protein homolog 2, mitochondrial isoform X2 [Chelonia mydas]